MQKLLNDTSRFGIGNDRGSTLVLAVVLAILMAIGGIGFVLVTTNSLNNDSDTYTRDKAFHAAESGALLAKKWLMLTMPKNWSSNWTAAQTSSFQDISLNGLDVQVDATFTFSAVDTIAQIKSAAYKSTTHNQANFIKRIVMTVKKW